MKKQQTKKQKSQKNDTIKTIIEILVVSIIVLLIMFSEDIVNLYYKNKIAMLTNSNIEIIQGNPNAPKLSAGMIPVKCVNNYWQIAENNTTWYDYTNGEPAYMMLNDGTYQSELVQNMDRNNQKLASENIGAQIQQNQVGSIYMWIPRFEINNDTGEIKYIQDVGKAEEGYTIPDLFMYKQTKETAPDFLLTGIWVAIDTDENYATTITNMTGEDNTYGFIANTKSMQITENDIYAIANVVGVGSSFDPQTSTQQDNTANVVGNETKVVPPINDLTNTNRIILKIINTKDIAPKLTFDVNGGTTTVENITVKYGETITLPMPERKYTISYVTNNSQTLEDTIVEYTFDGWYTEATGGEKREYTTMPAHNETLYAHWTETSITLPILTPENKTYTVAVWYSDSELTTKVGNGGEEYTPTNNIILYAEWEIDTTYYGALVTNYSAGGVSRWRVFHIDNNGNIYLITDDYVPNANIPTDTRGTALSKGETYRAYWNTTVLGHYTGSAWIISNTNTNAQKWLNKFLTAYPSSTNKNIKAVAYMMDTASWSGFAGDMAEYAIGGSTIELYCASYKVTHPNKYIECTVSSKGYKVKWSTDSSYSWDVNGLSGDDFNGIYTRNCKRRCYWIFNCFSWLL